MHFENSLALLSISADRALQVGRDLAENDSRAIFLLLTFLGQHIIR